MKKSVCCLLLAAMLLLCLPAQADKLNDMQRRIQYGTLALYENMVYGYSLGVYRRFVMADDDWTQSRLEEADANYEEGDDRLYDIRAWYSTDARYVIDIQVKEPTCASFEEEIANAPHYAEKIADGFSEENHLRQLHDGILRETPAGVMLETAVAYEMIADDGSEQTVVYVYYDIYLMGVEYCFCLYDYEGDYESAQIMLDAMMQTVSFGLSV